MSKDIIEKRDVSYALSALGGQLEFAIPDLIKMLRERPLIFTETMRIRLIL